jgi:hypothetical protein
MSNVHSEHVSGGRRWDDRAMQLKRGAFPLPKIVDRRFPERERKAEQPVHRHTLQHFPSDVLSEGVRPPAKQRSSFCPRQAERTENGGYLLPG